jgi:hypothetical protein
MLSFTVWPEVIAFTEIYFVSLVLQHFPIQEKNIIVHKQ